MSDRANGVVACPKAGQQPHPELREAGITIVVTGAGGFVGKRLIEMLLEQGAAVVGIDKCASAIPRGARIVEGDICSAEDRASAFSQGCAALVHLATIPGGAAEADPARSRRVNVDAMFDLLEDAKRAGSRPRVVFASSIAVFGDPLPPEVDDQTPLAPKLLYGGHKAMMEVAVAMMHNRGEIDGVTVRLPAIVARPRGESGMKSAFISNLFHALRAGEAFECPASPDATMWVQSVTQCARNLAHAAIMDANALPMSRALTLPALRVAMRDLAQEAACQLDASPELVTYKPDPAIEAAFGAQPPLSTPTAEQLGFAHDGDLASLVANALAVIGQGED